MARINLIYARAKNHCIGKNGAIPWHLPREFQHFKQVTMGHPIIMGRKTYEDHKSVLPGRMNILVTRQVGYQAVAGMEVVNSLEAAIALAEQQSDDIFIIGGVSFFTAGLATAERVYETVVDAEIDGDAYLPQFDFSQWRTETLLTSAQDERNPLAFTAYLHQR